MYPSLFPLRLKCSWHPGAPLPHGNKEDGGSGFIWPRGDAGERGIQPLNFQSLGMDPWVQQSLEPLRLGNELNLFQAISAAALQENGGAEFLMQQFLQCQQPFSFPQQSCRNNPLLQQQICQQTPQEQIVIPQSQCVNANLSHFVPAQQLQRTYNEHQKLQVQQLQTYAEAFQIPNDQLHQQQSPLAPQLHQKPVFSDSNLNFSPVPASSCIQRMLESSYPEGNATILNCSRLGNPLISEQNQQPCEPRFTMSQITPFGSTVMLPSFAEKDVSVGSENCANLQNHTLYGMGKDLPSSLSTAVPNVGISGTDNGISTVPYAASYFQNSLCGYLDGSSGSLQSAAEIDPATRTFVKVYKSGSVGRLLDITQFSSYDELRQELGQMFGIEGLMNDPLRSGWQLVFVDRENDVLLLGDDPWESFVNNVWYIKILSPEDVLKMGKQGLESFC